MVLVGACNSEHQGERGSNNQSHVIAYGNEDATNHLKDDILFRLHYKLH